jgi:tetratricopeptide (TPR) repeat protein
MKLYMNMVLLLSLAFMSMHASENQATRVSYQEIFLQGNKEYKAGNYEKALQAYTSIPDKSAAVWYNSGNCFYHLGNYIQALVAFKRAQREATSSLRVCIDSNITQTYDALGVHNQTARSYMQRVYAYIQSSISLRMLFWLQLLFLIILYAVLVSIWYVRRSALYLTIVSILGCLILLIGITIGIRYHTMYYRHGIVVQQGSLYVGPDKKYDAAGPVVPADEITILEKRPEWYKVKKEKTVGWIPAELVALID